MAIIGHSGCGKSTIVQLVERFYDTETGEVFVVYNEISTLVVPGDLTHLCIEDVENIQNCMASHYYSVVYLVLYDQLANSEIFEKSVRVTDQA